MTRRWQQEPAVYYIMRGGRIVRRPHEDFKPIDPNKPLSPLATFDFAALECALLDRLKK